jgi:hypothetical protein
LALREEHIRVREGELFVLVAVDHGGPPRLAGTTSVTPLSASPDGSNATKLPQPLVRRGPAQRCCRPEATARAHPERLAQRPLVADHLNALAQRDRRFAVSRVVGVNLPPVAAGPLDVAGSHEVATCKCVLWSSRVARNAVGGRWTRVRQRRRVGWRIRKPGRTVSCRGAIRWSGSRAGAVSSG